MGIVGVGYLLVMVAGVVPIIMAVSWGLVAAVIGGAVVWVFPFGLLGVVVGEKMPSRWPDWVERAWMVLVGLVLAVPGLLVAAFCRWVVFDWIMHFFDDLFGGFTWMFFWWAVNLIGGLFS